MKKGRKQYDDDDGRTIASMNVDGMPWYGGAGKQTPPEQKQPVSREELSGPERRAYAWGVLKAVLLIGAVFAVGYLLFILFCVNVWFK